MPAQDGQVVREMMPVSTESGSKIAHGSLLSKETREHVQADRRREQPGSISQLSRRSLCGHVRQNHRRHTAGLRGVCSLPRWVMNLTVRGCLDVWMQRTGGREGGACGGGPPPGATSSSGPPPRPTRTLPLVPPLTRSGQRSPPCRERLSSLVWGP